VIAKNNHPVLPARETPKALPLSHVLRGSRVRLLSCECGGAMTSRLESMGIRPGAEFDVIMSSTWGPMVIGVGNSRFALGRSMTHRMMVAPTDIS
jgi:ferrous iron transport protein A